jgi:hypothetical protein
MQRLLGWYRVGSSNAAVAGLLISNAIPLVGVLFLGWNVWTILIIYWLENGVIGFFNIVKMARAAGGTGGPVSRVAGKIADISFFMVHYGLFWLAHGSIILTLSEVRSVTVFGKAICTSDGGPCISSDGVSTFISDPVAVAIVLIGLFISHGVSYMSNYIGRGEYLRTNANSQMFAPYGRLLVLHVTILVGGFAIAITGAPAAAVVILVVLKTALDLGLHLAEHRDAPLAGTSRTVTPAAIP